MASVLAVAVVVSRLVAELGYVAARVLLSVLVTLRGEETLKRENNRVEINQVYPVMMYNEVKKIPTFFNVIELDFGVSPLLFQLNPKTNNTY